jgi:hypothetical protein
MRLSTGIPVGFAVGFFVLTLAGCNRAAAPVASAGPAATLTLKDGSTYAGSVTKSDTSAITVQSSTGETRTYPMTQVASVQYADQAPPLANNQMPNNTPPPPPSYSPNPAPAPAYSPSPAPPAETSYQPAEEFRTIPAGRTIEVRNNQTISSERADTGETYSAVVARDVTDTTGAVAIPRGSSATLVVRAAKGQGEFQGRSELALDVASVAVGGRTYRLETRDFVERGHEGVGENKRTGKFIGGGAALGGIIGAIAGGGKGAAIGALSGAGAGAVTQSATRGHAVRVPAESVLAFRLEQPIRIREIR